VQQYWDSHPLGTQFLDGPASAAGLDFRQLDRVMDRWEYKPSLRDTIAARFPGGSLLEVGCGLGTELVEFARRGLAVTGIDLAPAVVGMAKRHLDAYDLPGEVRRGNAQALDFGDAAFDVVYSSGVLQHVPDIGKAVDEIHRVLRVGGLAVCIVYHRYSWFNVLRHVAGAHVEFEDADPPIIHTYARRGLRRIFGAFRHVSVSTEYHYPSPTPRRGVMPGLYNEVLVPLMARVPRALIRPFGWHLVVSAIK
jgi:SAM-dependent methyltransferase